MSYRFLADSLVLVHAAFVLYALLGGLLVLKWRWTMGLHLPAALWAAVIEFADASCPLTAWENALREQARASIYQTGFVEHYILPILYPAALNEDIQIVLGLIVLIVNTGVYSLVIRQSALKSPGKRVKP
jgi:hypothetical protein